MTPSTGAGIGSIGSAISGIGSAYAQKAQYDIEAMNAKANARVAKIQGEADSLQLLKDFNKTMASNAVISAAQGRSGGSVTQIAQAAEAQYNWDSDFTKLSAQIQSSGYIAQAEQKKIAGKQAFIGGSLSSIGGSTQQYGTSLYKIGG